VRLIRFLRENYSGDEHLILDNDTYKRVRVIKLEAIGNKHHELLDILTSFSRVKHPNVLVPESYDLREIPRIYFPYVEGKAIDLSSESERRSFALFLINLLRELLHYNVKIPVLSIQDFLKSQNYFMLPPCWVNQDILPKAEYTFVAPEFAERGKFSTASTVYVFGKLITSICNEKEIEDFVADFLYEDPLKRKTHFPLAAPLLSDTFLGDKMLGLKFVTLRRQEENTLLQTIENLRSKNGLYTIFLRGPQRSGKTTLLDSITEKLRYKNVPVIWATDLQSLISGVIQLVDDKILARLDEQDRKKVQSLIFSHEFMASEVLLTLGKIMNNLSTVCIAIDDVHEVDISLRAIVEQLRGYKFKVTHFVLIASSETDPSVGYDLVVDIKPFDLHRTEGLIKSMLIGLEIDQQFCQWIYTISRGLPGRIVSLMRILHRAGALKNVDGKLQVAESVLKTLDFREIIEFSTENYIDGTARFLAICGEKFKPGEIEILSKVVSIKLETIQQDLSSLINDGFIYWESGKYRFILHDIWYSFYSQIPEDLRGEYHEKFSQLLSEPSKKAWHLKMLGKNTSAVVVYLLAARKELDTYNDISAAFELLEEAEKLLQGRESYALNTLKLRALMIKQDANALERFALTLEGKDEYNFLRYRALVGSSKVNLAKDIEQQCTDPSRMHTEYAKLFTMVCKLKRILISGEKVSDEFLKEIKLSIMHMQDFRAHKKLVAEALLLISRCDRISNFRSFELLNQARQIAQTEGFLDILALILNEFGVRLAANSEAVRYFDEVVEIAHKISSDGLALLGLSNLIWTSLYRGEAGRMFNDISRLRQIASMTGNLQSEAYSYFVEANYHIYNRELDKALEDLTREKAIEKYLGIEERALRGIVAAYALSGNVEESIRIIRENIDNPALNNQSFKYFRDLFLAEDDESFLRAWQRFLGKDDPYWREEACQVFAEKLVKLDREGFLKFAKQLEMGAIKSGAFLSLAQIYEAIAIAYQTVGEIPLAINYAERATSIYRTRTFENAARWLEENVKLPRKPRDLFQILQDLRSSLGDSARKLLDLVYSQIEQIMRLSNLAQYALDTLKVTNSQDEIRTTMEFMVSRIMNLLPISSAGIALFDPRGKVVEQVMFNLLNITREPKVSYEPFEICVNTEIADGYTMALKVANESLYVDESNGYELLKTVMSFQDVVVYTLKNVITYQRSITDPLTGLYTRWYFVTRLYEEFERVKRYGGHLSIIMCDIDDFKKINDTYGHRIGDEVLKFISSVLRSSTRITDIVGRYGGEEFIMILPNTPKLSAAKVAEKVLYQIIETNPFDFRLTMSFGVSGYPEDNVNQPEELINFADKATYMSKERGKSCVTVFQ
jgi:diguanylate cyclase (GGDEF)-like protein